MLVNRSLNCHIVSFFRLATSIKNDSVENTTLLDCCPFDKQQIRIKPVPTIQNNYIECTQKKDLMVLSLSYIKVQKLTS